MPLPFALWPGGPVYEGESVQTDALSLCGFVRPPSGGRGVDLGCGDGILMLLLCHEHPSLRMDGVDIRPSALKRAEANFLRNGLAGCCRVYEADVRELALEKGVYDLAVCNPPYFSPRRGGVSPDGERAAMRAESAELGDFCRSAAALLKNGGRFYAVYPASRLPALLRAMEDARLAPKRLRCVQHSATHAPSLVLCEGRKSGGVGLVWEPPLLLRDADGRESAESLSLTHWKKEGT